MSDLRALLASREMILVAGSGGVGKTTVAAAMGLAASAAGEIPRTRGVPSTVRLYFWLLRKWLTRSAMSSGRSRRDGRCSRT